MYFFFLTPLLAALASAATPFVNFEDWHPPTPNDMRSPCPALNSLANHGILPRDGRNLTVPILVNALVSGLNSSQEIAGVFAQTAMTVSQAPDKSYIDLDDLNKHNAIEHDASLSRKDVDLGGEAQKFCPRVWAQVLAQFDGKGEISLREVAKARWARIQDSKANNPHLVYGPDQQFPSYLESAVYHLLFKNPETGLARVDWINAFFSDERLPYNEGWRPINVIEGFAIAKAILQLAMFTPEKSLELPDWTGPGMRFMRS